MKNAINKPNLFLLGAGKSGTTALSKHLKQHPDVYMSPNKEPMFFCDNFHRVKSIVEYFKLFDGATSEKWISEASHAYMTDPESARIIKGLFPEAKFLLILRNPADRAHSMFQHMKRLGYETINKFEKALEFEDKRFNSKHFYENNRQFFYNYMYFRSGLYGEQIRRYFDLYKKNRFYIMKFTDFIKDPEGVLRGMYDFLEVDYHYKPLKKIKNKGYSVISGQAQWIYYKTPESLKLLTKPLLYMNRKKMEKIKTRTREKLMNRYRDDLDLLYDITGVNID